MMVIRTTTPSAAPPLTDSSEPCRTSGYTFSVACSPPSGWCRLVRPGSRRGLSHAPGSCGRCRKGIMRMRCRRAGPGPRPWRQRWTLRSASSSSSPPQSPGCLSCGAARRLAAGRQSGARSASPPLPSEPRRRGSGLWHRSPSPSSERGRAWQAAEAGGRTNTREWRWDVT